jgi:Domain of unknown function (DUF4349)
MRTTIPSLLSWFRSLSASRQALLIIFALCIAGMGLSRITRSTIPIGQRGLPERPSYAPILAGSQPDAELKAQWERLKQANKAASSAPLPSGRESIGTTIDESGYATPMIAHAAELAVATKEFAHSRSTLEEILERHHGYAAKLRMVGQPASSMLTATLRIPSSEFTAAVNDLKTLGSVEREEETADEITQHRADLDARLANAQNRLERLQGILAKGGKINMLLESQRQLANVSAEIARLESQRASTEHQVTFAQVLLSLREEVKPPVASVTAEFRDAVTAGLADVLSSLTMIALIVITRGPVALLWAVLVFLPGRWMWRKWHTAA